MKTVNGEITIERHIDDVGYEEFIDSICKKIVDKTKLKNRPPYAHIERGSLKWLNGVVSDTHMSIVWDGDRVAGIGISTRTAFNYSEIITVDLFDKDKRPGEAGEE